MKKTVMILQCCKKKRDIEIFPYDGYDLAIRIPNTKRILEDATTKFSLEG